MRNPDSVIAAAFCVLIAAAAIAVAASTAPAPSTARADDAATMQRIVLALEANARATQDLARATRDKCR